MPTAPATDPDFVVRPIPRVKHLVNRPFPDLPDPLGPLKDLAGTWHVR